METGCFSKRYRSYGELEPTRTEDVIGPCRGQYAREHENGRIGSLCLFHTIKSHELLAPTEEMHIRKR